MPDPIVRPYLERFYESRGDLCLCLSGGGFRAAAFHLGVVRWLYRFELLSHCGTIRSVSGGSIVAAWLSRHAELIFSGTCDLNLFDAQVAAPLMSFLSQDHRTAPIVRTLGLNVLNRQRRCNLLASEFDSLFAGRDAPDEKLSTRFAILGFDLESQALVAFSPAKAARDLSMQVVASAAFPPIFGPVWLAGRRFTDAGLVSNLGVTGSTLNEWRCVLVSDASRAFPRWALATWAPYTLRLVPMIRNGADRSYRDQLGNANSDVNIVGIAPLSSVDWFGTRDRLSMDLGRLGRLRTDLAGFSPSRVAELMDFGEAVADETFGDLISTWAVRSATNSDAVVPLSVGLLSFLRAWRLME